MNGEKEKMQNWNKFLVETLGAEYTAPGSNNKPTKEGENGKKKNEIHA